MATASCRGWTVVLELSLRWELVIVMQKQSRMKDVPWKLAGSQGAMKVLPLRGRVMSLLLERNRSFFSQ